MLQSIHIMPSQKTLNDSAGRLIRISTAMLNDKKKIEWLPGDMQAFAQLLKIDIETR